MTAATVNDPTVWTAADALRTLLLMFFLGVGVGLVAALSRWD